MSGVLSSKNIEYLSAISSIDNVDLHRFLLQLSPLMFLKSRYFHRYGIEGPAQAEARVEPPRWRLSIEVVLVVGGTQNVPIAPRSAVDRSRALENGRGGELREGRRIEALVQVEDLDSPIHPLEPGDRDRILDVDEIPP